VSCSHSITNLSFQGVSRGTSTGFPSDHDREESTTEGFNNSLTPPRRRNRACVARLSVFSDEAGGSFNHTMSTVLERKKPNRNLIRVETHLYFIHVLRVHRICGGWMRTETDVLHPYSMSSFSAPSLSSQVSQHMTFATPHLKKRRQTHGVCLLAEGQVSFVPAPPQPSPPTHHCIQRTVTLHPRNRQEWSGREGAEW